MKHHFFRVLGIGLISALVSQSIGMPMIHAQDYQVPDAKEREKINMGDTPWKFIKSDFDPEEVRQVNYDDSAWQSVGVPHCFNDMDTFTNTKNITMYKGTVWYRKHFSVDPEFQGKKLFLEFQGVNVGAAVYVNGNFKPGNSKVSQPDEVTHVGGFLPFTLDITDDVNYGGENVIAVRVSNTAGSFFTWPGFGTKNDFGMGYGGIVSPVYLHVTDKVHIPSDSYSPLEKWGTYLSTISADESSAQIRMQTNVENEDTAAKDVTLLTQVADAEGTVVLSMEQSKTVNPGEITLFDQSGSIENPTLWYPNASLYGTPYLYHVYSSVQVDGKAVDQIENTLGIRTITWDKDYCYINGKKHLLNGFGNRNTYPALGSAVPAELQWQDIRLMAEAGANALRVGHISAPPDTVAACDAYGIMVIQNSGDDEWSIHDEPANTYKKEYDRDMIIRDRNHPSIAVWEANNGMANSGVNLSPKLTYDVVQEWDYLSPRIVHGRDKTNFDPGAGNLMIGYTNWYWKQPNYPSMNMEAYGAKFSDVELDHCIARFDYENEKEFSDWYVREWNKEIADKACGFIDWMLVETWGEGYTKYLNGMKNQKSLGSSAMDGNRIPKLKYNIWKNAVWMPYEIRPGVTLQSHWNYPSGSVQTVDAWSNCASVELFVNDVSKGVKIPDANKRCTWAQIPWESGTLCAVGRDAQGREVCRDERTTAGEPDHIALRVQPMLVKPDGTEFACKANGSDVTIIEAVVEDKDGNWCPLADQNLHFSVSGPASYRGSYNFYIDDSKPAGYHAPGDPELQAEGGRMKVAVRAGFQPGTVTVSVDGDGLAGSEVSFETVAVPNRLDAPIPDFNLVGHSLEGEAVASLPVGENEFRATYQNNTKEQKNADFVVTLRKGNHIMELYRSNKSFAPFEEYQFVQKIQVPEIQDGEDAEIRAYFWDGLDEMKPQYGVIRQKINNTNPVIIINDTVVGPDVNQLQYIGDWGYSSNEMCYDSDNHWTNDSSKSCVLTFEGIQATYYGAQADNNGKAAISIDGGPETIVDLYSPSAGPSGALYITPVLPYGRHTLKVRVTGEKHPDSEYNWVNIDRFDIRTR